MRGSLFISLVSSVAVYLTVKLGFDYEIQGSVWGFIGNLVFPFTLILGIALISSIIVVKKFRWE